MVVNIISISSILILSVLFFLIRKQNNRYIKLIDMVQVEVGVAINLIKISEKVIKEYEKVIKEYKEFIEEQESK